jgi:YHS domain-containing protein
MKKAFLVVAVAVIASVQLKAQKAEVFSTKSGAINGYDPVAFFTEQKPVKGNDQFTYKWKDAEWHFSSQQNLDSFAKHPEKYAPQYGGYCAYGCSEGHKAPTIPDTWTIINGKLYFNYNNKVKELWNKNREERIEQANKNWFEIKNKE